MLKNIVAVDLFCGAGGLTRGLINAGISVKKGYDNDPRVKKTYEKNNLGTSFISKDIARLSGQEVINGLDRRKNYFLLAGCAPCQPFSSINKNNLEDDKRKNLVLQFARLIEETKPDFVLMENVPGLLKRGKRIFQRFEETMKRNRYKYDYAVLNASDYGVPQSRKRLIFIASKNFEIKIPVKTHGDGADPRITVRKAISHYPVINSGEKHPSVPNHECRSLSQINTERLRHIRKDGGSRSDLPKRLKLRCHQDHSGHSDVYGRMKWDSVSPTLTCKCTSVSNGRFGHPDQDRGISIREAAAIQTFSDEYIFYGNMSDSAKWVGNAVPVRFAQAFGEHFINLENSTNL